MNTDGEIIIVDDDSDDIEIFQEVYNSLPYSNKLLLFQSGEEAYQYIIQSNAHPFLIISDINMTRMNGFQLREKVFTEAARTGKVIPFIFLYTGAVKAMMKQYCLHDYHGYFEKRSDINAIRNTLEKIIGYWNDAVPYY